MDEIILPLFSAKYTKNTNDFILRYTQFMYIANMCEYMYKVLSMHIDRQAITPLGDREGTMGG